MQLNEHWCTLSLLDARPRDHGNALITARVLNNNVAFPRNWTLNARLSFPLASACIFLAWTQGASRSPRYIYHTISAG